MIVAADGSGDFISIQEAVDAIPENNKERVIIQIKNGTYKEKIHIEKPLISLVGESADNTILTYDDYAMKKFPNGEAYNTFNSYSIFIGADDFTAENLTFENSAGRGEDVGQAVAAYVDGDRVSFINCRFLARQDTLFTAPLPPAPVERASFGGPRDTAPRRNGRQYYKNCYIRGDIDFIFGSATAVFDQCEIASNDRSNGQDLKVHGWITAPSTPEDQCYGYVFMNCRLTSDAPENSVYLGRPWRNYAKAAFIHCWMGKHIRTEGWDNWNKPESEKTTLFCEYNSEGPGAAMDQRVAWARILTAEEAGEYTTSKVLSGKDGWNPGE